MPSFQDYLRQVSAYNRQKSITAGQAVTDNPYGPPELLSAYLEGQTADEERAKQLQLQERSLADQEKQFKAQQTAEMYQLGAQGLMLGGYGLYNADKIIAGGKAVGGLFGSSVATQPAIANAAATSTTATGAAAPGAIETSSMIPAIGPLAGAGALTYGSYEAFKPGGAGEKVLGSDATRAMHLALPFVDPAGSIREYSNTFKNATHSAAKTWKKVASWF